MQSITHYLSMRKRKQLATVSATRLGSALLTKMQLKLRLAGEELQRMEDEGGIPLSNAQNLEAASYLRASTRLKTIIHSQPTALSGSFFRKQSPMPQESFVRPLLYAAVVIAVGVLGYNLLSTPDTRNGMEKVSDAVGELPNGVDKAARQLESRTPADKLEDAAQDAKDDFNKSINQ